mgnify:CR=1 FL=1
MCDGRAVCGLKKGDIVRMERSEDTLDLIKLKKDAFYMLTKETYQKYIQILHEELIPAMGCTEPIAIAYAASIARAALGEVPERVRIDVSGNIIKNVKSVIVPNTGGLHGLEAAAAAGIIAGDAEKELLVISEVSEAEQSRIADYLKQACFTIKESSENPLFDIKITCGEFLRR